MTTAPNVDPPGDPPQGAEIALVVNGEPCSMPCGATVADLLRWRGLEAASVAVERNRAIVRRAAFAETELAHGDRVELVGFVGGG